MNCPQCKGYKLEPVELEPGLVAAGCHKCGGNLLPLLNYRFWVNQQPDIEMSEELQVVAEDSTEAKICPKCARLMNKYKLATDANNRFDFCASCEEVWMDKGEWDLLKSLKLHNQLSKVFTDEWQRKIQIDQKLQSIRDRYSKLLGEEDFSRVEAFKNWLDKHDKKESITQFLLLKLDSK